MKKFMQKKLNQKGLTLVELLAVIVILGIIAAIAVPSIGNIIENTKYNAVKADAINALNASNVYFAENSNGTEVSIKTLTDDGYLENAGKLPTAATDIIKKNKKNKELTATAITYSTGKTIIFNKATIESINADTTKGSAGGAGTITSPQ